jgi:hypothetical protein
MSLVTLLWFGHEAYFCRGGDLTPMALPDKGDPAVALGDFLVAMEPRPKTVQLIYQPACLDPVRASCTRGARTVLAKVLAREFPAIANPTTSWAALAPQPFEGAYTTLLFIETRPRIPRLASILNEHGIAFRGAWPLPALLETIPPFSTLSQPGIFLVTTAGTALVYALLPNASRSVTLVNDVSAPTNVILAMNTALTYFDRDIPPPVQVISLGEPWPLGDQFDSITPVFHDLPSLIHTAGALPTRASSNFAPPDIAFPWNRLLQLASAVMIVFAIAAATIYTHDLASLQADEHRRAAIADDERNQVNVLRQNRDTIYSDMAFTAEVPGPDRTVGHLLSVLVKSTPTAITMHSLTISDGAFKLEGTIHEGIGLPKGAYADFYALLANKDQPWTLAEPRPPAVATAGFMIAGTLGQPVLP